MDRLETPMPLERFEIYRVDQALRYWDLMRSKYQSGRMFAEVRRFEFLRSEGTLLRVNSVQLHGARVAAVASSGHRIGLNDELNNAILLPLRGLIEVECRHGRHAARPGGMLITAHGERVTSLSEDYLGIVLLLPRQMLVERAGLSEPDDIALMLDQGDESCSNGVGGVLRRQLLLLVDELNHSDAFLRSDKLGRSSINLLADLLVEFCIDSGARRLETKPVARGSERQVKLAEEFICANLAEPISMADVAASVGISLRSLQAAFKSCRGTSPKSFLTSRRLERARGLLLQADPCHDSVTSIVYECGLTNAGRFAAEYRSKFGEYPSETLAALSPRAATNQRALSRRKAVCRFR